MRGRTERKKIAFRCHRAECADDPPTETFVEVPRGGALSGREREITRYCRRDHVNLLTVPAEWDRLSSLLDRKPAQPSGPGVDDSEVVGRLTDSTPIVQGRRL